MGRYFVLDIETHGLNAWGEDFITCICAKDSDGNILKVSLREGVEELDLIKKLDGWMVQHSHMKSLCVTHNGIAFDIPFILTRGWQHRHDMRGIYIYLKHFDTMKIAKKWVSLDDLAFLFQVDSKNGNGKNAIYLYDAGKFDELEEYCMNDVLVTEQIFKQWWRLKREKEERDARAKPAAGL